MFGLVMHILNMEILSAGIVTVFRLAAALYGRFWTIARDVKAARLSGTSTNFYGTIRLHITEIISLMYCLNL